MEISDYYLLEDETLTAKFDQVNIKERMVLSLMWVKVLVPG